MGLFNDTDDSNRQDEVVIDAPADDSSTETRLGKQVESNLINDSETESGTEDDIGGSDVSIADIHRQNETIIDLLEKLVDKKDSSSSNSRSKTASDSRNSNRVTDRGSSSGRVTDRKGSSDNNSIGDGMNELL